MRCVSPDGMALALVAAGATGASVSAQTAIGDRPRRPGVEIEGRVAEVFGNRFVLDDGTGGVLVEAGPPRHHRIDVEVGEAVRMRGEPDAEGFDAFEITRADGETLRVRPDSGQPPWAGGPRREEG